MKHKEMHQEKIIPTASQVRTWKHYKNAKTESGKLEKIRRTSNYVQTTIGLWE